MILTHYKYVGEIPVFNIPNIVSLKCSIIWTVEYNKTTIYITLTITLNKILNTKPQHYKTFIKIQTIFLINVSKKVIKYIILSSASLLSETKRSFTLSSISMDRCAVPNAFLNITVISHTLAFFVNNV